MLMWGWGGDCEGGTHVGARLPGGWRQAMAWSVGDRIEDMSDRNSEGGHKPEQGQRMRRWE